MQRWALGIEFSGRHYRGWQTQQAGIPSVQHILEQALSKVANHPVIVHAAGRTDAGVHASNMIVHLIPRRFVPNAAGSWAPILYYQMILPCAGSS